MSTIFKFRRGITSAIAAFTGAAGEVVVDTTKNTLVVQDGATAGGFPLARILDVAAGAPYIGAAGGTANAITAAFPAAASAYSSGQPFVLIASGANTGAVAVVLTLGGAAQASIALVKGNNAALAPGDIPSAGYPIMANYSATFGALVMQNPATGINLAGQIPIGGVFQYAGAALPSGTLQIPLVATAISRTAYAALFAAITIQTTGNTTSGNATITAVASTAGLFAGMPLSGPGIQAGATVASFTSNTIVMSLNATATAAGVAVVIAPFGVGDGSTTFGLPYIQAGFTGINGSLLGAQSAGQVIAHNHTVSLAVNTQEGLAGGGAVFYVGDGNAAFTSTQGGAANLPAGTVFKYCIRYA